MPLFSVKKDSRKHDTDEGTPSVSQQFVSFLPYGGLGQLSASRVAKAHQEHRSPSSAGRRVMIPAPPPPQTHTRTQGFRGSCGSQNGCREVSGGMAKLPTSQKRVGRALGTPISARAQLCARCPSGALCKVGFGVTARR